MLLVMTVILGVGYPLVVLGVGQAVFHSAANGSMVTVKGRVVGSSLIGQSFSGPMWFHSRPSAAGAGYDPMASGASNLSPSSAALLKQVEQRRVHIALTDGVSPASVPPDALTASGSGLDPSISVAYANEQVRRVASQRGLSIAVVRQLVADSTRGRSLGFLGEPTVNVLALNVGLARMAG